MNRPGCVNECYSNLSFIGVAFDPNFDTDFCNYLYNSGDGFYFEEACCC